MLSLLIISIVECILIVNSTNNNDNNDNKLSDPGARCKGSVLSYPSLYYPILLDCNNNYNNND